MADSSASRASVLSSATEIVCCPPVEENSFAKLIGAFYVKWPGGQAASNAVRSRNTQKGKDGGAAIHSGRTLSSLGNKICPVVLDGYKILK